MPEDNKKSDKKNAKEQRKPRQRHQQVAKAEKKPEKLAEKVEESPSVPKVSVPQKPPVYESPPPEFFKNLKRETDEILKITEEENSKYKKKEIQSNWSKYEVAIDSYEEIDEQENMGADFEKLIKEPLVAGGHFQFKHEKSWDINTGPTQYDKYFEIDMDDLSTAVGTLPFYERNNIDRSIFKEVDILTMNNRATKFKQKYYNDKSYSTPEIEAHDKILNSLRDDTKNDDNNIKIEEKCNTDVIFNTENDNKMAETETTQDINTITTDIGVELIDEPFKIVEDNKETEERSTISEDKSLDVEPIINSNKTSVVEEEIEHDDFIFRTTEKAKKLSVEEVKKPSSTDTVTIVKDNIDRPNKKPPLETKVTAPVETKITRETPTVTQTPVETKKPVIESPEDLEKWLDDFLDG